MINENYIITPRQFELFKSHLKLSNNSRIILSGKFGIGKTTFLREFFKENAKEFNIIHLYPINYSISTNEDILDLLKYDIIYSLINDFSIETEEFDFNDIETLPAFINYSISQFITPILELSSKTGKSVAAITKIITKLSIKYNEFKSKINSGESDELKKLGEVIEKAKGSFYQSDFYIDFISKKLIELKEKDPLKKNILIIDDLDRIDPEHIFRLFNVFGAHLHSEGTERNKFDFDQVIFTCDIDNIEAIYRHKYGKTADFSGYIDKFYSNTIFRLDNSDAIRYWVEQKLPLDRKNFQEIQIGFLIDILLNMIKYEVINFRSIKSINKEVIQRNIDLTEQRNANGGIFKDTHFIWLAPILATIAGHSESLISKLNTCKEKMQTSPDKRFSNRANTTIEYMQFFLLPVAEYTSHGLRLDSKFSFQLNSFIHNGTESRYLEYSLVKQDKIISIFDTGMQNHLKIQPNDHIFNLIIWDVIIKAVREISIHSYLFQ